MGPAPDQGVTKEALPPFDPDAFVHDLRAARDATKPSEAEEQQHLKVLGYCTTLLGVVGVVLAAQGAVSPLGMVCFAYYKYAKFAILAHHSLHGGFGRERRGWYAQGLYRRVMDWLDWIFPTAWIVEHNKVHHYCLNEDADPDFVERNTAVLQSYDLPVSAKYALAFALMPMWKWYYYASNTLKLLHAEKANAPSKAQLDAPVTLAGLFGGVLSGCPWHRALAMDLFLRVLGPPLAVHFLVLPFLAGLLRGGGGLLGLPFCWYTLANLLGAEAITNVHAFCTIVTNHAGSDLWWFDGPCKPDTAEFYLRAILGSTAYHAGNDFVDFFHGYLNYQGEHHAFPDLSPLHYQRLHPHFKRVCARHGVPYVQEAVWRRVGKTLAVVVGEAKHQRLCGSAAAKPERWRTPRQ